MVVGIPPALAKYSGWSLVYATRGILPAGLAGIAGLVRLLAWPPPLSRRPIAPIFGFIVGTVVAVAWWFGLSVVNQRFEHFVSDGVVLASAAYFAVVCILLVGRTQWLAALLLLGPVVASSAFVNPIGHGLPGFYQSETFRELRSIAGDDHTSRWLVLGRDRRSTYIPYLVKAAGGNVLNGIRCNPDMEVFKVLDPDRKHFDVWNRFAVVSYERASGEEVVLTLTSGVSYTVAVPFKPELLDRLGIKYILTIDMPSEENAIPGYRSRPLRDGLVVNVREGQ
jgi:hypothetical protein